VKNDRGRREPNEAIKEKRVEDVLLLLPLALDLADAVAVDEGAFAG
jgi:hypothetical protein